MTESIPLGTRKVIDGQDRTYYYGYWIKAYDPRRIRSRPRSASSKG